MTAANVLMWVSSGEEYWDDPAGRRRAVFLLRHYPSDPNVVVPLMDALVEEFRKIALLNAETPAHLGSMSPAPEMMEAAGLILSTNYGGHRYATDEALSFLLMTTVLA